MSSYTVAKRKGNDVFYLNSSCIDNLTFGGYKTAWSTKDHQIAAIMMNKCVEKHKDNYEYTYFIDDLDESGDY